LLAGFFNELKKESARDLLRSGLGYRLAIHRGAEVLLADGAGEVFVPGRTRQSRTEQAHHEMLATWGSR